jgi:GNAT superfamily N-acetyltransferase
MIMSTTKTFTPSGYSHVQPGHVASVVTCLEMTENPHAAEPSFAGDIRLERMEKPNLEAYRTLYRKIGAEWLWFSRLIISDEKLASIIGHEDVEVYVLRDGQQDIGLMELDFRQPNECELVFLGLTAEATGKGLGRALMNATLNRAWQRDIKRLHLHTCTLDHPSALGFYLRSGFRPYAFQVETQADPRLTGHLPLTAAPHVPLIQPQQKEA